ncbi:ROK family transcriptional regulator [Streptomyces catenulae]|uniref:ROK family transcriptional regulator n=1 Tax=Streptomyces catenulae TaxID=66875 RepID=A0ABV2YW49_9ACTN|nr:ROK family transcriptional regulator [Streptomyces catenulae]
MHAPRSEAVGRTASPTTARRINDRLALQLLQDEGPLTATRLRELTGLSRPTVADLVERLRAAGLIAVVGESGAQRRGPNARLFGIVADRAHLLALDLRDHGVSIAVADLLGEIRAERTVPLAEHTPPLHAVRATRRAIDEALTAAGATEPHTVAVGAPGLIDPESGRIGGTDWVPRWHHAVVTALEESGAPVLLENEVNLAAVAEARDGAARARDTFVLLWLGQGTGAAVVLDGRLRRGASGGTGEIGFLPVPGTGGLPSAHGCTGGFHSLAGSRAVVRLAAEYGIEPPDPAPVRTPDTGAHPPAAAPGADGPDAYVTAAEALMRAAVERPGGAAFLDDLAARVALGVAAVSAVLDPGCVVLGGEVGQAGGPEFARRVAAQLARVSPLATEVRAGTVGGRGVLRGAVLTARDAAQNTLFPGPAEPHH